MAERQISRYRLLIVAGGNFVDMGNSLTASTTANVRNAVRAGMNYLGICAGGFLAGSFPAPYNTFNLSSGVKFGFYSAENNGTRKAAVRITLADGPALDQYWEDGPQFAGWGEVVGKYPDGTPAIVEGSFGHGWVILCGVHPEFPASWRREWPSIHRRVLVLRTRERSSSQRLTGRHYRITETYTGRDNGLYFGSIHSRCRSSAAHETENRIRRR